MRGTGAGQSGAEADAGAVGAAPSPRLVALRIAGIHLRTGSLGLARAELEAAAGRGALDEDALLDLAETRWRTGDLAGAGEVANALLATGRRDATALVVAAEAVAALGRPSEARRLASLALAEAGPRLDEIFAGMPRSHVWPVEGSGAVVTSQEESSTPAPGASDIEAPTAAIEPLPAALEPLPATIEPLPAALEPLPVPAEPLPAPAEPLPAAAEGLPVATDVLDAGRRAIADGDLDAGALQLAIALRLAPALAPAVLDAAGAARSPQLELLRGDALRAAGRELDARRAYAAALGGGAGSGPGTLSTG